MRNFYYELEEFAEAVYFLFDSPLFMVCEMQVVL